MTNRGLFGWPSSANAVPDGAVSAAKLSAPLLGVLTSGYYYFTGGARATTTLLTTSNRLMLSPWYVPNTVRLSVIGAEVTTVGDSGSKVRLGIYADDGTGEPGQLVLDAGTIAGDSGTVQDISINQALAPGLYWIGGASQVISTTAPTVRAANEFVPTPIRMTSTPSSNQTVVGVFQSAVPGTLPAAFVRGGTLSPGLCIRTHVRIA